MPGQCEDSAAKCLRRPTPWGLCGGPAVVDCVRGGWSVMDPDEKGSET